MKIGILTYHRTLNYGAFLQAYSLKSFLEQQGHTVDIIDYWPNEHQTWYKLIQCSKTYTLKHNIKLFISGVFNYPLNIKRNNNFTKSIVEDLNLKKKVEYPVPKLLENVDYDCIVYGSDQIWRFSTNKVYHGFDSVYYGDYVPQSVRRVAYAASMGVVGDFNQRDFLIDHLKKFNSISVRENNLKEFVESLINVPVKQVIDPVFLNSKSFWINYLNNSNQKIPKEKYILFYNLIQNPKYKDIVKKYAKSKNLQIVEITGSVSIKRIFEKNVYQTIGVKDFLKLLYNAEVVFSSSFHGVAFSIIFQKLFYAFDTGTKLERVRSLLNGLSLENQIIKSYDNIIDNKIEYNMDKLIETVSKSKTFCIDSIKGSII